MPTVLPPRAVDCFTAYGTVATRRTCASASRITGQVRGSRCNSFDSTEYRCSSGCGQQREDDAVSIVEYGRCSVKDLRGHVAGDDDARTKGDGGKTST